MSSNVQPPVYPPSTMLPPPVPSLSSHRSTSSSSGRKRKRPDAVSSSTHTESTVSSASEFSQATKKRVLQVDRGQTCWHCGAYPTQVCHVFGRRDHSFSQLVQQGLLTFDHVGHYDNAIPLCPTCHVNFDDITRPGLFFLPSDLQYFIDFEKADFERREEFARNTSTIPPRICPTPQMYFDHQIRTDVATDDAPGGLYLRYTLHDYFPKFGPNNTWIPGIGPFQEPESWHGAPMAALWRAFLILGNPLCRIPDKEKRMLRELQDLYQRHISIGDLGSARARGPTEGDGQDNMGRRDEAPPDSQGSLRQCSPSVGNADPPFGNADNSTTADSNSGGSLADSAIDVTSSTSKRDIKRTWIGFSVPKQCVTRMKVYIEHQPRQKQKGTSYALPNHRPCLQPREELWRWGPSSTSGMKAYISQSMMGSV